jgi:hypothetical protein
VFGSSDSFCKQWDRTMELLVRGDYGIETAIDINLTSHNFYCFNCYTSILMSMIDM